MIKAQDLTFEKFEDENTPEMQCNVCYKKAPGKDFLYADIQIAADASFMIVMCSEKCQKAFVNHKLVDEFLREKISEMKRMHRRQAIKKMGTQ